MGWLRLSLTLALLTALSVPCLGAQTPSAAAELGAALFVDTRLSANGTYSCASCHDPQQHFTDGLPRAVGVFGETLPHNTPTLYNAQHRPSMGWSATGPETLVAQHLLALANEPPVELGLGAAQLAQLDADAALTQLRREAYPDSTGFDAGLVAAATAAYVRTLSYTSAFDRYLHFDETDALDAEARTGLALFTSAEFGCASCHNGPDLGGGYVAERHTLTPSYVQVGSQHLRVPSLRALRHTAPYMHDGRLEGLAAVLDYYAAGADATLQPIRMSQSERRALIAFLNSL